MTLHDEIVQLHALVGELRTEAGQDSFERVEHLRQAADRLSERYLTLPGVTVLPGERAALAVGSSETAI